MSDWKARARKVNATEAPAPAPTEAELEAMRNAELEKRIAARPTGEGSFATGLKQGATFGFADELAGAFGALGALAGDAKLSEAGDYYRQARDEERKRLEESRKADPLLTGVGQVGGALLVPVGAAGQAATLPAAVGRGVLTGAATGALQGAGESKDMASVPVEAAKMGAFGALAGGALPVAAAGLQAGKKAATEALARPLARAGEQADELRVLTTMGATGGTISAPKVLREAERVPGGVPEMARVLRESGISSGLTTTSGVLRRAQRARAESGKAIGDILADATARGGQVDARALAGALRQQADEAVAGVGGVSDVARQQAMALKKLADRIDEVSAQPRLSGPAGTITPEEAKQLSVALGQDAAEAYAARAAGRSVTGKGEALMTARRATEEGIDAGVDAAGLSSEAYRRARRLNQVARIADETAEANLGRASKNNLIDLTSAALAGGGPAGAAIAGGRKILGPLTASGRATAAEAARGGARVLRRIGEEAAPTAAPARAAGALGAATMGAQSEPMTVAAPEIPRAPLPADDAAIARDLLQRGMSPQEVASILGDPSMDVVAMLSR
jgi:hypothetical protein